MCVFVRCVLYVVCDLMHVVGCCCRLALLVVVMY